MCDFEWQILLKKLWQKNKVVTTKRIVIQTDIKCSVAKYLFLELKVVVQFWSKF